MILHGDEVGRSQQGNNNVYCQDNELSWIDWAKVDKKLLAFTQQVMALRAEHPIFRRRRFFTGDTASNGLPDIAWLSADGTPMDGDKWGHPTVQPMAVFLNGCGITEPGLRGEEIHDDSFLIMLNPGHEDAMMALPEAVAGETWELVLDTGADPSTRRKGRGGSYGARRNVNARSLVILRHD
jgi:glycogen operon protein